MAMWRFSKKAVAVGVGAVMGVSASLLAMVPNVRQSEAAIAVVDEKNIEEAIKTAVQTAKILTEAQKQYALMLLNIKKLDVSSLLKFLGTQDENLKGLDEQYNNYQGVLSKSKTLENIWKETVGDYESVLSGKLTIYDMYKITRNRAKMAQDTVNDATVIIKNAQETNKKIMESNKAIIEKVNEAEGELQVEQGQAQAIVNTTTATVQGNEELSALVSYAQMDRQDKEGQKAAAQALYNSYASGDNSARATYNGSKNMYKER